MEKRGPLEKLLVSQLLQKLPRFYGTRNFSTVFTTAHCWVKHRARWILCTHSQTTLSRSVSVVFSHTCTHAFFFQVLPFNTSRKISGCIPYFSHACYMHNTFQPSWYEGYTLCSWLRHYATSRKVAGSSPDEVDIFNLPNPSSRTVALWSTQPLTEMSTRNLSGR
jgi:hypothetical protein